MNSKQALERIKNKYKGCLVKEAHELPFSYDINIDNIEEYWHIENKNDFSQIEKDLEVLEILKNKNVDVDVIKNIMKDNRKFECYPYENLTQEEFNKIKDWLENE